MTKFDTFSSVFYQHHNYSNLISTLVAQCTLLSVKMLHSCGDCHMFFSFPCNFNTKKQLQHVRKTKRHDIFVNYWLIFSVGSPLTAKIFTLGNTCTCISSISQWMFGFQTRSNSFEWKSLMQLSHSTKPTHKKNWIDHLIFEVSQTLSWVIEQSGTHIRNTRMEQNQTFQFQAIDGKCVNYWSSVKAVKAM